MKSKLFQTCLLFGFLKFLAASHADAADWLIQGDDWNTAGNWYDNSVPAGVDTTVSRGLSARISGGYTNTADGLHLGATDGFLYDNNGDKIWLAGSGSVDVVGGTLGAAHIYIGDVDTDSTGALTASAYGTLSISGGNLSYTYLDQAIGNYHVAGGTVNSGETRIGTVGGVNVAAYISSASDSTTVFNGSRIYVGSATNHSYLYVSGSNTTVNANLTVGDASGSVGSATLSDGAQWNGGITAGGSGTGTLNIQSGATVSSGGHESYIGLAADANGTVNVGTGGIWNAAAIYVGGDAGNPSARGTGVLNITGGNVTTSEWSSVGGAAGSSGVVNVTSGTWTARSSLAVGSYGNGVMNVDGGVVAANSEGSGVFIGDQTGSKGTVNVTAGELKTRYLEVGVSGSGELNVRGGAVTTDRDATIGEYEGGVNTALVTGGSWSIGGDLILGFGGTGTLKVNGGTVSAGNIYVGQYGVGVLEMDAGTLNVSGQIIVAYDANSHGTLNYNGGALNASSIVIGDGSATVNFNQAGVTTVGFGLTGNLEMNVNSTGTTTLTTTNSYVGKTSIKEGTLVLAVGASIDNSPEINLGASDQQGTLDVSAKTGFSIGSGQTLCGYGTVKLGDGKTLTVYGTLAPGNSPGITSVIGDTKLDSVSMTLMEIAGLGGVAGVDFDQLDVSGTLTLGGALNIGEFGGFDLTQTGSYTLFKFTLQNGAFNSVTVGTTELALLGGVWSGSDAAASYRFSQESGILEVVAVPEPATVALVGMGLLLLFQRTGNRDKSQKKSRNSEEFRPWVVFSVG